MTCIIVRSVSGLIRIPVRWDMNSHTTQIMVLTGRKGLIGALLPVQWTMVRRYVTFIIRRNWTGRVVSASTMLQLWDCSAVRKMREAVWCLPIAKTGLSVLLITMPTVISSNTMVLTMVLKSSVRKIVSHFLIQVPSVGWSVKNLSWSFSVKRRLSICWKSVPLMVKLVPTS